jgi:hypothetical protein
MNATLTDKPFEELAYRESDGIEVSLLWTPADDSVSVLVTDARSDDAFEIAVAPEAALDAFEHPFAYAAAAESGRGTTSRSCRSRQSAFPC